MGPDRKKRASWAIGALAVAQMAVGVVVVATDDGGGIDHPNAWDERVLDLVAFVEEERGHNFEHPVLVEFLTPEQYSERTRTDEGELTDEDREEIERAEALMRAVGLLAGDVDLFEAANDLSDAGTLAYYDSGEEKVVVRGTDLTPQVRTTLVHELTHVLQDQVWDIDKIDDDAPDGAHTAWRALVEGDADNVEERYESQLTEEERAEIDAASEDDQAAFEAAAVPPALTALFFAPYLLGDGFIDLLAATSDSALDDAFANPPSTDEHLMDPFRFLAGDEPEAVAVPDTEGAEVLDEGDFGAASLYVVLAERIPVRDALNAVTGWGGDAFAVFDRDGRSCVRIDVTGDSDADDTELESALAAWVAASPAGTATSGRAGDVLRLEACDPGDAAVPGSGVSMNALVLVTLRVIAASTVLNGGGTEEQALCYGSRFVELVPIEALSVDTPDEGAMQSAALEAAAACR